MLLTIDNGWVKEEVYHDIWTRVILVQETDVTGHTSCLEKVPILIFVNNVDLSNSTQIRCFMAIFSRSKRLMRIFN